MAAAASGDDPLTSAARAELAGLRLGAAAARRARDGGAPPPGAALDSEPFARNWASYLRAVIEDKGAHKVMNAAWSSREPDEGGFLLGESLRRGILAYLTGSVIYSRAMVLDMPAYRLGLPTLDNSDQSGGAQAMGGLEWSLVPEGSAIPATSGKFGRSFLDARKVAALLAGVPLELLEDASDAVSDLLGRVIGLGYRWFVEDLEVNGTGAGEPQGLLYASAAYGVTRSTSSAVLHTDVVGMLTRLHPASKSTAVWLVSDDAFGQLLELYENVGTAPTGQTIAPPGTLKFNSQTGQWELMGLTCLPGDHQPTLGTSGDVILADLSWLAIGERDAMSVEVSQKGSGFISGTADIRIRGRLDVRYMIPGVITLANGVQRSPLVVLD